MIANGGKQHVCLHEDDCNDDASHLPPLTGHLDRGIDGVFEIVRVIGLGLVSIGEVHAIVAGAYLAQSEPRWRAIDLAS